MLSCRSMARQASRCNRRTPGTEGNVDVPTDDDLVKLLCDLVAIDSSNPGLTPGAAGEEALVRFLARRLAAAGLEVEVWEPRPRLPDLDLEPSRSEAAGEEAHERFLARRPRRQPGVARVDRDEVAEQLDEVVVGRDVHIPLRSWCSTVAARRLSRHTSAR